MYLKILMIFGFAIKMSVKLFTDILHLFAKFQWKFPTHFAAIIEDIDDTTLECVLWLNRTRTYLLS